jgi:hypothetical protein
MVTTSAIPTQFAGINFRSRLEAKWAAFFELCGWHWHYEPLDLNGYIPDFIVQMQRDVLFEVKPFLRFDDPQVDAAIKKIEQSGWPKQRDAVVVGSVLIPTASCYDTAPPHGLGVMMETDCCSAGRCASCGHISFSSDLICYGCRLCGRNNRCPVGDSAADPSEIERLWRQAGNLVQWYGFRR